jgi:hypothetical protein
MRNQGCIVGCLGSGLRQLGFDFFQHQAFLHARVARIACPNCGVRLFNVPWARPGFGFTLLFEAIAKTLARPPCPRARHAALAHRSALRREGGCAIGWLRRNRSKG